MANGFDSAAYAAAHTEKMVANYETQFKESAFAKPQSIYFTITAQHLYGESFVMEQEGTMEGDPVYCRFVIPLEDITKIYINDRVKTLPLFIQCDTNIKGIVHRKRIIVPCLPNVQKVVEQIKEVHAAHMKKFERSKEKERERKLSELQKQEAEQKKAVPAPSEEPEKRSIYFDPSIPAAVPKAKKKSSILDFTADLEEDLKALEKLSALVESGTIVSSGEHDGIEDISAPKKRLKTVKHDEPDQVPDLEYKKLKAPKKVSAGGDDAVDAISSEDMAAAATALENAPPAADINDSVEEIKADRKKPPKVKPAAGDALEELELPPITELPGAEEARRIAEQERAAKKAAEEAERAEAERKAAEEAAKAEEERRAAEEAAKAEAERKAAEEAAKAEAERRAAEEAARAEAERKAAEEAAKAAQKAAEESRKTEKKTKAAPKAPSASSSGDLGVFESAMRELAARRDTMSPEEFAEEKKKLIATLY